LREADRVGARRVKVLPAAVDLELLLVEPVDEVAGAAAFQRARGVLEHSVGGGHARSGARLVRGGDEVVDVEDVVAEVARVDAVARVLAGV